MFVGHPPLLFLSFIWLPQYCEKLAKLVTLPGSLCYVVSQSVKKIQTHCRWWCDVFGDILENVLNGVESLEKNSYQQMSSILLTSCLVTENSSVTISTYVLQLIYISIYILVHSMEFGPNMSVTCDMHRHHDETKILTRD